MSVGLQKANFWKRFSAFLFDIIFVVTLAVGLAAVLSLAFGYTNYSAKLQEYYTEYELKYAIDLDITEEAFNALSASQQEAYRTASQLFSQDERVLSVYYAMFYLSLAIAAISILISVLVVYFLVPLFFKNGQTLGKKIFGLAVMRTNCVKISNFVLFARTVFGLYTIEIMVPVLLITMIYFNVLGIVGTITIGLLLILEIVVMCITQTNSSIHDLLADTVVVEMSSQQIFETEEALIAYKQEQHELEVNQSKEEN